MKQISGHCAQIAGILCFFAGTVSAADTAGTIGLDITNGTKHIALPKVSGVDEFKVLRSTNLQEGFKEVAPGSIAGYNWQQAGERGLEFFKVEMTPKSPQALQNANLLNRIAYGPTPDELERLSQIGPDAYIREQLAPENIQESLEVDRLVNSTEWQYATVTGNASSSTLYLILTAEGDCYIDDIKIVPGNTPEQGGNAVINGDFEAGLAGWTNGAPYAESIISTTEKHSGAASLHLKGRDVDGANVESSSTAMRRADLGLRNNQPYTLSYWYKAGTSGKIPSLLVRLSGADPANNEIYSVPGPIATKLAERTGGLNDLAAWHSLHAIESKKQLLEVMLQFLENHFVTQQTKSRDYFDGKVPDGQEDATATNLEYREIQRWRQALLNPNCTFYDLLKISAESPAMIIYLDTVNSRGDGSNIANENYARELLELFTFGVDNGYDQNDITIMSRAWTGWSVDIVDWTNEFNPFAPKSTTLRPGGTNQPNGTITNPNLDGTWAFNYRSSRHSAGPKVIFPEKTVPARFGAPYAGRNYELKLAGGTNWQYVTQTMTNSSSTIYLYITGTGDCYLDDLKIVPGTTPEAGTNAVKNGDFEAPLTGWTITANMTGSAIVNDVVHSGSGALHLVSAGVGTGSGNSVRRADLGLAPNTLYTLSYWYLPGSNMNGNLVIRTSGSGFNSSPGTSTNSIQEAYEVIAHLADQPFTQEFISVKLCRLLVHDDFATGYDFTEPNLSPEGKLVQACMQAWESGTPKGQIRKVLEVILNSDLFRSQGGSMQKIKTPLEFTVSAVRALRALASDGTYTATSNGEGIRNPINRMGRMRLFDREEPDGWPEAGAPWISAGTLTERLRFVQALLLVSGTGKDNATGNNVDPVKLLKTKLPQNSWTDVYAVAEYFVNILYPAEGRANLDEYRSMAGWYLNTGDDANSSSPFSALDPNSTPYDTRVRGMVAMLMTLPRFQEQ